MACYSKYYLSNHCVDIFFLYNGTPMLIITDGTDIPPSLNDKELNISLQCETANMIEDANLEDAIIDSDFKKEYIALLNKYNISVDDSCDIFSIYRDYASIGFFSYACCEDDDSPYGTFKLVSYPRERIEIKLNLPQYEELKILSEDEFGRIKQFRL